MSPSAPRTGSYYVKFVVAAPPQQATGIARIDVRDYAMLKRRALAAHRTQISYDSPFFRMSEKLTIETGGEETFMLAKSRIPTAAQETDFFEGLRG